VKLNENNVRFSCIVLLVVACSAGCVRRRMTVRTSPPGATISVDNQVIGTSPAAANFVYYGTREFRVEKDGFRTETIRRRFNPPWYEFPGVDFIAETLWPGEIRDERIIDVELVPKEVQTTGQVLERADALRQQSRAGIVTAPR
jgi:PEGA domain